MIIFNLNVIIKSYFILEWKTILIIALVSYPGIIKNNNGLGSCPNYWNRSTTEYNLPTCFNIINNELYYIYAIL